MRTAATAALWVVFAGFSLAVVIRAFAGPIDTPAVTIRTPLNVESFVAMSFLLLLLARATEGERVRTSEWRPELLRFSPQEALGAVAVICVLCLVAFRGSLDSPFLFDDYGHIVLAARAGVHEFIRSFYVPHSDIFFRPVGFLSFAIDVGWAHFDPFRWHAWSLIVHTANCALVYLLIRQLGFSFLSSTLGAVIFAIHGTRAEAVCWADARFDILATFFVLLGVLCVDRYVRRDSVAWLGLALFISALALLTKEASYALPLILLALTLFYGKAERRRLLRTVPVFVLLCVLQFIYRLWIIGGVGGYQTGRHANVLSFSAIRSAKALLWRFWAFSFFPLNWAPGPDRVVQISLAVYLVALAIVAASTRVNLRWFGGAICVALAACVPVQHLLLLESDLAGSRILYLPLLGIAILWAAIAEAQAERPLHLYGVSAAVVAFYLCCLQWNIHIWTRVAETARSACQAFGQVLQTDEGSVVAVGLPAKYQGVFFLSDAFPECVELNSGVTATRVIVDNGDGDRKGKRLYWNPRLLRFDPVEPPTGTAGSQAGSKPQ